MSLSSFRLSPHSEKVVLVLHAESDSLYSTETSECFCDLIEEGSLFFGGRTFRVLAADQGAGVTGSSI